ncbi:MAG: NAD(P)-dependent oxidoreductase [Planctomycetes bacterium]|nr:NAD(P)-dependent oxidoreductase [Planctomycetota bacterium]
MSSAAVIGAAGFVGRHLCRALRDAGYEVYGYDYPGAKFNEPGIQFYEIDISQGAPMFPASLAGVFYLAQSPFYRSFPEKAAHLFAVNALGALDTGIAAREAGAKLMFFASTGNVYSPGFASHAEDDPVFRDTPYALSKLHGEEMLAFLPDDSFQVVRGRIFGAFGPGQRSMLPAFVRERILAGEAIRLDPAPNGCDVGEGLHLSFAYVLDLCDWLLQILQRAESGDALPSVLNLGGEEVVGLRRFSEMMATAMKREALFVIGSEPRKFDLIADPALLKRTIQPKFTPLQAALEETCRIDGF